MMIETRGSSSRGFALGRTAAEFAIASSISLAHAARFASDFLAGDRSAGFFNSAVILLARSLALARESSCWRELQESASSFAPTLVAVTGIPDSRHAETQCPVAL